MFNKNHLGHSFIQTNPSYSAYRCENCNVYIEHMDSEKFNFRLKKLYGSKYDGDFGYLLMEDSLTVLELTCKEMIVKNIIE